MKRLGLISLLIAGGIMSINTVEAAIISHSAEQEFDLEAAKARIKAQENPLLPIEVQLRLLDQLNEFELGKFLLRNQGLNGPWTSYVILHGPKKIGLSRLEDWFLNRAPVVLATRERFGIFQREIQNRLRSDMALASVPCGLMEDLMTLDFQGVERISLTGMDLDDNSLEIAHQTENSLRLSGKLLDKVQVSWRKRDAWNLQTQEEFDLITSNGLNIYEREDQKVMALYQQFYRALKHGGVFITSFLTPPPAVDPQSPWKMGEMEPSDLLQQKVLMSDIIGAKWTCFRSEETTRRQLSSVGFKNIQVIYDSRGMFPTVLAEK